MYRIDSANNVGSLPAKVAAEGSPGYFNNNPGAGPGTKVTGDFLNTIQEELVGVIVAAGATPDRTDNAQLLAALRTLFGTPTGQGQCLFKFVSTTSCKLVPFQGNGVAVAGAVLQIPAAGISVANTGITLDGTPASNLAANTTYLGALNGAGTLEFWTASTSGHSPDTTAGNIGVEVITGHPTRTLVGMVCTDAAAHFADSDGQRLVLSWFNRRLDRSRSHLASTVINFGGAVAEIDTSIRNSFLVWAGQEIPFSVSGSALLATTGNVVVSIAFNGTTPELEGAGGVTNTVSFSGVKAGLPEGLNYATLVAGTSGTTVNFTGGTQVIDPSIISPACTITIGAMG